MAIRELPTRERPLFKTDGPTIGDGGLAIQRHRCTNKEWLVNHGWDREIALSTQEVDTTLGRRYAFLRVICKVSEEVLLNLLVDNGELQPGRATTFVPAVSRAPSSVRKRAPEKSLRYLRVNKLEHRFGAAVPCTTSRR